MYEEIPDVLVYTRHYVFLSEKKRLQKMTFCNLLGKNQSCISILYTKLSFHDSSI